MITDILETKFTKGKLASFIERKMNKSMHEIIKKCDIVIIPEKGESQNNIRRIGPIVRQTNSFKRRTNEKNFHLKKEQ